MRTSFYQQAGRLPAWLLLAAGGLLASPALAQTTTFAPVVTYPASDGTYRLAVADVNGDGKLDALTSTLNGQVGVQLGNGDGTFQAVATYASGDKAVYNGAVGIAVADVNADTKPDVLVVNNTVDATGFSLGSVNVLLGNGNGTFRDAVPYLTGAGSLPRELVLADVNLDGRVDAVVSDSNAGVIVLLGNGNGTFQPAVAYTAGADTYASGIAVGDVNYDGLPDIVVSGNTVTGTASSPSVELLLGKSRGTFQPAKTISKSLGGNRIKIAEVTGGINGGPDLVTNTGVLSGDGTGNFYPSPYPAGSGGTYVAVGDVNGDGFSDILTADFSGSQVSLLLNNAGNSLQAAGTFSTGADSKPTDVVVADVNGDGKRDVLTPNLGNGSGSSTISVLLNTTVLPTKFTYTGGTQTYTVPAGVTRLAVVATGANGGLVGTLGDYVYTNGAQVKATVTVTPGEVLTVVVGGAGTGGGNPAIAPSRSSPASYINAGGYNSGGSGGSGVFTGSGGGGATDLRRAAALGRTDDYLASRNALVVAGGGGGSDQDNNGDSFPGSDAGTPASYPALYTPVKPTAGSFSAGGNGATQTAAGSGSSPGTDGNGGNTHNDNTALFSGGGGGGGYYGGGAGTINMGSFAYSRTDFVGAGGGGGSSFVSPTGSTDISYRIGSGGASLTILPITPLATAPVDLVVTTTTTIAAGTYNSITVNAPGVGTLGGNVTVTGSTTVNSGATLNDGCAIISGAGTFTVAAGGTLGICSAQGIAASGATGAVQTTGTRSFSADASYVYNGTAAQSTGTGLPSQVRNLSTTNATAVTLASPTSVAQVLTVGAAGNLVLNGQALTLLSSASGTALLVNSGTGVVSGTATVQRYIDPSKNAGNGYRHYAAPVSNTTVADLATGSFTPTVNDAYNTSATPSAVTPFPTVFGYDQALVNRTNSSPAFDKGFFSPAALATAMVPGRGYTVQIGASQLVDFVGSLTQAIVSVSAARNATGTLNSGAAGWQFLGNPYASPLDFTKFSPDSDYPGLDASLYVQESSGPYAGSYRAYVNGMGASPLIASSQGFFMRKTVPGSTTVTFRNSQRVTTFAMQVPFYRLAADLRPQVQLALRSASGQADAFYAYAEAGATAGFDSKYDAWKLANSTGLNLAGLNASGESLSIDGRPAFTPATAIALTVGVPAAGTYALAAADIANLPAGLDAYLRDAQTGQVTKLSAGTSYAFSVTGAEAQATIGGRFSLQFSTASPLATVVALAVADVSVYPNPARESFTVVVPTVADASQVTAQLCNALGQVVRQQTAALPATGARLTVATNGLAAGVYVLRLAAGSSTIAKRVVIQ